MSYTVIKPVSSPPNIELLEEEINIAIAPLIILDGISYNATSVLFNVETEPTPGQDALIVGAILAHDPLPLSLYKASAKQVVDVNTVQRIEAGFVYAGLTFSLSANARQKWTVWRLLKDDLPYPFDVPSIDDTQFFNIVTAGVVVAMVDLANDLGTGHLIDGTQAKKNIENATTKTAVDTALDDYITG